MDRCIKNVNYKPKANSKAKPEANLKTKSKAKPKATAGTLITLFILAFILVSITCTSCCIDLSEFSKPKNTKITFTGDSADAAKIDELIDKYNINTEDLTNAPDSQIPDLDYTIIKKELASASGYQVSAEEEDEFFGSLEKIYDKETFALSKEYLKDYKILFPSGYFTLIKVTQKQDYSAGYGWFDLMNKNRSFSMGDFGSGYCGDINIIVHELTHSGSGPFINLFIGDLKDSSFGTEYSYLIGNLLVSIKKDRMFFSKYELLQDIKNPDKFDETYLDPDKTVSIIEGKEVKASDIDFTMILDELNAYTVSEKCAIATESYVNRNNSTNERYGLLKQMSYLELYLKRCYEKYPDDWKYLTEDKGLSFLIMKLWQEAEKFETAVKDDARFNLNSGSVSGFVYNPDNYGIIEMFFGQSGILDYKSKSFNDVDAEFGGLTVYDINDL
jgi:hypothetical protein